MVFKSFTNRENISTAFKKLIPFFTKVEKPEIAKIATPKPLLLKYKCPFQNKIKSIYEIQEQLKGEKRVHTKLIEKEKEPEKKEVVEEKHEAYVKPLSVFKGMRWL